MHAARAANASSCPARRSRGRCRSARRRRCWWRGLRDEAHRFAITYHRQTRGRIGSELDEVPGVGPTRRKAMLRHFGSLSALRAASREQLRAMPGLPAAVADAVFERLQGGGWRVSGSSLRYAAGPSTRGTAVDRA